AATATITVERIGLAGPAVSVNYSTTDGTAQAGSDYQGTSGTLNFAPSQTSATFTVTIKNDALIEPDETVALSLSGATGGAQLTSGATATLTITNDDIAAPGQLQFASATYGVSEGTGQALI